MRNPVGLVVVAVLAAVAAIWWITSDAAPPPVPPREAPPESSTPAPVDASPDQPPDAREEIGQQDQKPAALTGRLVVVDPQGAEHTNEDGSFALHVSADAEDEPVRVEVRGGAFEIAELAIEGDLRIADVRAEGRLAYLKTDRYAFPADRQLVLRAHWLPDTTLRVVDAQSGIDLEDITLVDGVYAFRDRVHPGSFEEDNVRLRNARSPLTLPEADGQVTYWVHAAGYDWAPVRIDRRAGGERRVALSAGAVLRVHVPAADDEFRIVVRVYPAEGATHRALAELPPSAGSCTFEGLPAGEVEVRAEIGIWSDPPLVLGRAGTALTAGRRSEVTLDLQSEVLEHPAAPLAGTLALHKLPEISTELRLEIRPTGRPAVRDGDWKSIRRDEMTEEASGNQLFGWRAGRVTPGSYVAILHPYQLPYPFDVPTHGTADVLIEAPEVGTVHIRIVDRDTRLDAPIDGIYWSGPRPEGLGMWAMQSVERDQQHGGFRFHAPLGRISLGYRSDDYAERDFAIEVQPGVNEKTITTHALPVLWLQLRDNEVAVPFFWGLDVEVRALDGEGSGRMRAIENGRARVVLTHPGRYEIQIATLDGYAPIPPQTVDVQAGTDQEHTVTLQRAR